MLAFYKALLGAVEISRVPDDGPAFYVGLQIGNAELGVVADGDAHIDAPQRILLNVNVGDLGVGNVAGLLEHVEALGGRVLGPPNDMPWGQRVAHIQDPDGNTVNLTDPSRALVRGLSPAIHAPFGRNIRGGLPLGLSNQRRPDTAQAHLLRPDIRRCRIFPYVAFRTYQLQQVNSSADAGARWPQPKRLTVTSVMPRSGSVALGQAPLAV